MASIVELTNLFNFNTILSLTPTHTRTHLQSKYDNRNRSFRGFPLTDERILNETFVNVERFSNLLSKKINFELIFSYNAKHQIFLRSTQKERKKFKAFNYFIYQEKRK